MYSKKVAIFGLLLIIALASSGVMSFAALFPKAEGLDVDMVVADPFAYKGEIKVRGGVMSVDPEKKLFQIIDYREYRSCQVISCAAKWITVNFSGKLPGKENVVEIKGVIERMTWAKEGSSSKPIRSM